MKKTEMLTLIDTGVRSLKKFNKENTVRAANCDGDQAENVRKTLAEGERILLGLEQIRSIVQAEPDDGKSVASDIDGRLSEIWLHLAMIGCEIFVDEQCGWDDPKLESLSDSE